MECKNCKYKKTVKDIDYVKDQCDDFMLDKADQYAKAACFTDICDVENLMDELERLVIVQNHIQAAKSIDTIKALLNKTFLREELTELMKDI